MLLPRLCSASLLVEHGHCWRMQRVARSDGGVAVAAAARATQQVADGGCGHPCVSRSRA
jgi:hypothetical protein